MELYCFSYLPTPKAVNIAICILQITVFFMSAHQRTPMHIAAQGGQANTVKLLINKGADIDIKDNTGVSALRIIANLLASFLNS